MTRVYCETAICQFNDGGRCKAKHLRIDADGECKSVALRHTCGDCAKFGQQCADEHPHIPVELIEETDWPCKLFKPRLSDD